MEWLDSLEAQWRDAVTRWENLIPDFQAALEAHWANRDTAIALGPDEFARWQTHLDHALQVKTAVEMLQEAIAATSAWAKTTFGLSGLHGMGGQLGAIPLIPVAVIVGSISTVTAVIYALRTYNAELEVKKQWLAAHPDATSDEVAQVLNSGGSVAPVLAEAKDLVIWIVVGGVLLFFGPKLLERFHK